MRTVDLDKVEPDDLAAFDGFCIGGLERFNVF